MKKPSVDHFINDENKCFILNGLDKKLNSSMQKEGHIQYWCSFCSCSWMGGWMGRSKSGFKDCLQQSKNPWIAPTLFLPKVFNYKFLKCY
jgi:hypothetical protein